MNTILNHNIKQNTASLVAEYPRTKAVECFTKLVKQQTLRDSVTDARIMVAYNLAKNNNQFSDGEFVKHSIDRSLEHHMCLSCINGCYCFAYLCRLVDQ